MFAKLDKHSCLLEVQIGEYLLRFAVNEPKNKMELLRVERQNFFV